MLPDDPRHGTNAGYAAGCRGDRCRQAATRWHKELVLDHIRGHRRLVDATGTRRRIQALIALGYSGEMIAQARGSGDWDEIRQFRTRPRVKATTAAEIADVYARLSATTPVGTTHRERQIISRTQNWARKNGWLPPIWWDDIDNPDETPSMHETSAPDPVVVDRILAGDWHLKANRSERLEVLARWVGSDGELERRTGWNVARDRRSMTAAKGATNAA